MDQSAVPVATIPGNSVLPPDPIEWLVSWESRANARRNLILAIGIPVLILATFLEALYLSVAIIGDPRSTTGYSPNLISFIANSVIDIFAPQLLKSTHLGLALAASIGMSWAGTWAAALAFFYFGVEYPLGQAQRNLDEMILRQRYGEGWDGRREKFQEDVQVQSVRAARVFLDNRAGFAEVTYRQGQITKLLGQATEKGGLGEAQLLLNQIEELILQEQGAQKAQLSWRNVAMAIMVLYIAILAVIAVFTNASKASDPIPVFGVPLSVAVWAAAGSLAAILYKFYTEKGRIQFDVEVRWLIARPVIGVIMGAVVYLALVSGMILMAPSSTSGTDPNKAATPLGHLEVYWIIAFLAGFSDKVYLGIINLLVDKTIGTGQRATIDSPTTVPSGKESATTFVATLSDPPSEGGSPKPRRRRRTNQLLESHRAPVPSGNLSDPPKLTEP